MPTFIDESGDVGPNEGCARHFRLAAAWFEDRAAIDFYIERVAQLKRELNVSQTFEFHFAKIRHQYRIAFYQAIADVPFRFAFCTFEKQACEPGTLTKDGIRTESVAGLVSLMEGVYLEAESRRPGEAGLNEPIKYDQCDDKSYAKLLKERFRAVESGRGPNKKLVGDVKPGKAKADPCIQIADMACGATGRHVEGEDEYYSLISDKIIGIRIVGAKKQGAIGIW